MAIPSQSVPTASSLGHAVLVLSRDGRIQIASAAAATLWQARPEELVGDFFPNLFAFEVTSQESGWVQSQWEVLVAAAAQQPIPLKLQPKEAGEFEVLVRLEPVGDAATPFLAFISRPSPSQPVATVTAIAAAGAPAEHFLGLLNDRGPLGFFDLNFLRNDAYFSPTWKNLLGYGDGTGPDSYEAWRELVHPDDSAAAPDRQGHAGSGARPFSHEFRMRHALGHYVWVQCVGIQVHGPNGALQRVLGANLEIGERKESEEMGLRAEERLRVLGGDGRTGWFDLDFKAGSYWLSPGFKTFVGYRDQELPDTLESVLRSLPIDETTGGAPAYFLARHPDQAAYFDIIRLRHRENREVAVQACIVRQFTRKRELQRVLGLVMPLAATGPTTDTYSSHPISAVLDELHEGVLITEVKGRLTYANAKAAKLIGRPLEELLDQDAGDHFRLVHLQSGQPGENPIAKVLASGEPISLNTEFALETADSRLPVAFSARVIPNATGRPAGAIIVFRLPDEMALTPEELVRANRFEALGHLASGIAHDFNNLLTTILGGVSLAKENRDYAGLENSERACLAAKALSKQLLTFSRGGSGVRQVLRTTDILTDTVRLAAAGSTVKVDVEVAPDTGTVQVDRAQILQVFQNLVINAIQAMPTGQGRIWIKAANTVLKDGDVPPLTAGTYVAVEVRDNGSGIKPEHLEKIFDPFFTTKKTGTGLGLATVLSIVKRHGGQMGVESELGTGTTFTVFLPVADQPGEVEARRAPTFNVATKTGRVLFMDDDPQICALTGGMLEGLGYKFDLAKNGEEAVQFYKRYLNIGRPYDLVILDLTIIGGMGGEQTFKALRELHSEVRVIIASGYDNDDMARQFLDMGFLGYLTKPYRVGDLGRVIKKVLGS